MAAVANLMPQAIYVGRAVEIDVVIVVVLVKAVIMAVACATVVIVVTIIVEGRRPYQLQ